jgi:hypothetical protein
VRGKGVFTLHAPRPLPFCFSAAKDMAAESPHPKMIALSTVRFMRTLLFGTEVLFRSFVSRK